MTDLFGIKVGTPSVCSGLLGQVLNVKFVARPADGRGLEWYVAEDVDRGEVLLMMGNRAADGDLLEPYAPGYEVLFYVERSYRPTEITRKVASETSFRFLEVSEKLRSTVERVLRPPS